MASSLTLKAEGSHFSGCLQEGTCFCPLESRPHQHREHTFFFNRGSLYPAPSVHAGKSADIPSKIRDDLVPTMINGWKFWVPAASINFYAIPVDKQVRGGKSQEFLHLLRCKWLYTTLHDVLFSSHCAMHLRYC